ncbi:FAD-dependent oxidoreductase [Aspergillus homomorphus CBS 101889]|uniref:FAD-binding domain-containing protein n=1 Tax=Aspergillus homomorphus (strain CBS 101889) TaxID=1450537 RepID=A0A395HJ47_ASPHC|nr:FAD-binding domain-containing protein [Aspergillus homomorphus CBS 101889]RAL07800.1 FAD-binding domain-containing protein [Aspergillus homomorphus CBS 101889]
MAFPIPLMVCLLCLLGLTAAASSSLRSCLLSAVDNDATLAAFKGDLLYQTLAVKAYNLNYPVTPAAVTFPTSSAQVSEIVQCASTLGYKVQAKSGGHSYANYGLGGTNGAVVVDLQHMKFFTYNPTTQQATVGAGMLNGELDTHLVAAGNRAVSHGTSPQIGIGGHATIGGLGPTARQWGMELDHVVEAEVVLANGSVVRATATENADLLFAIKGAGASFGVVTEFVLRTEAAPAEAVQYTYTFDLLGSAAERADLFAQWQGFITEKDLSRKLASIITILSGSVVISGTFFGSKAEFEALGLADRFPGATPGNSSALVFTDWLGLAAHWAEQSILDLTGDIPAHFYARCLGFREDTPISADGVQQLFEYLDTAHTGALLWFVIFDLEGGAINDVPMGETGFAHRDVLFWMQSYAVTLGQVGQTTYDFLDGINEVIRNNTPGLGDAVYPGYVDPRLEDPRHSYWGDNLARLQRIKTAVDPDDVFHNPQGVLPA